MVILSGPVMARDYVNMRSSPPPPGEVCASDSIGSTPSYPLSGITVQASEELRGVRRDLALSKVLQMPDVQAVTKYPGAAFRAEHCHEIPDQDIK